ncbi:acyl-CoA dehydrogenase family protein [Rhizobium sp. PDO1-076]|uniref:acyl-CoA dehydrogenase family protein n=1 Tax=Rhizobium sp. PDO1-076 TaxID=1125979 RepID=UPI00056C9779|nr:acyl-CoA dehydrogenase family protein [Rhizobium sp. PDO1-076]
MVSDDQARSAIQELSALGGDTELLDVAAKKGLLAISVPSDFGGADLPNELIADLVTAITRQSPDAALGALSHFVAIELIRSSGTSEQRRGIYNRVLIGERFAHVGFAFPDVVSAADGIGLKLALPDNLLPQLRQDWTVLPMIDERSRRGIAVVSASLMDVVDIGAGLHLPGDNVLVLAPDAEPIARAVEVLLEASIKLGGLMSPAGRAPEPEYIGQQAIFAELLSAMIARVSGTIDGLQVGSTSVDVAGLSRSVVALQDLNRRANGV